MKRKKKLSTKRKIQIIVIADFAIVFTSILLVLMLTSKNSSVSATNVEKAATSISIPTDETQVMSEIEKLSSGENLIAKYALPVDFNLDLMFAGMDFLDSMDFTAEGAAGIIANAYVDSKFYPDADSGKSYGIFQWDYDNRWYVISKYLKEHNSHYDRLEPIDATKIKDIFLSQLSATLFSEDGKYYSDVIYHCKYSDSASEAADYWMIHYKFSNYKEKERRDIAEKICKLYLSL